VVNEYAEKYLQNENPKNSKHQNPNIKQIPITQIQNSKRLRSSQAKQKISDNRGLNLTWITLHFVG